MDFSHRQSRSRPDISRPCRFSFRDDFADGTWIVDTWTYARGIIIPRGDGNRIEKGKACVCELCNSFLFFFHRSFVEVLTNFREVVFFIIDSGFFFFLSWSWIFLHRNPLYEFSWHSRFSPVNNLVDKFLFRLSKR